MKLNFWQILGLVLIVGAVAAMIYSRTGVRPATPIEPVAPAPQSMPPDATPTPGASPTPMKSMAIPTH